MIIREFRPQDLKTVLKIERDSFTDPYPAHLLRDIYNLGAGFLVAQVDGRVVGFIIFWIRFEDEVILSHLQLIKITAGGVLGRHWSWQP